ncbi:hypothetical protein M9458_039230, partial [Cirrhinus mrigala]
VQDDGDVRAGGASVQQRERRVHGAGDLQQLQQLQTRQRRARHAAHQVTRTSDSTDTGLDSHRSRMRF